MGWGQTNSRALSALSAGVLAVGLLLATPVAASADKPDEPGKSSVVAACKKGGWTALAPEDDAAHPFRNQGECVQYLAQGGEVVATTGTPAQPGAGKGCKPAKAKASDGAKSSTSESHGKACKPRKAKAHGHKAV